MIRFPSVFAVGGLFATDLIDQIADGEKELGQRPIDFGLKPNASLLEQISTDWNTARTYWEDYQRRLKQLESSDPATSLTREAWVIKLLSLLGYEPAFQPKAEEIDGLTFAVSHHAGSQPESPPLHIVGCRAGLDSRPPSGHPRLAPHALMQEYLNRSEHLWGIVTNGYLLRLLRDNMLFSRQAYLEFDLQAIFEEGKFADFTLFWRLLHTSRLPHDFADAPKCWLELYYQRTVEEGGRVREHLRDGVERALLTLANGFLRHPNNGELREKVCSQALTARDFYRQLLRLIYRFLFLMVTEERNLLTEDLVYRDHYSLSRLRNMADRSSAYKAQKDLWQGLKVTFRLLADENVSPRLGLPPLGSDLFLSQITADLNNASLNNAELLAAVQDLSRYQHDAKSPFHRINYAGLDVEELGSVYESLLDLHPLWDLSGQVPAFRFSQGTERKTTGSHYTRPDLVHELVKSALLPVIEERLKGLRTREEQEKALLSLKVGDLAAGSGHFLLATARVIGKRLASVRSGEDQPTPRDLREAVRDVISNCIYGVDKNPLAVDLCRVALWIEGHSKGKPLTFLNHRIKVGDSLVGVTDLGVLQHGIPDEAFDPVSGDDKVLARQLKKANKIERERLESGSLAFHAAPQMADAETLALLQGPEDTPQQIHGKEQAERKLRQENAVLRDAADLWTYAFFAPITKESMERGKVPTTGLLERVLQGVAAGAPALSEAQAKAFQANFFHWPLEFPEVFRQGGFDCELCNPPWERIKLQQEEFFATRDLTIAQAPNKASREGLIKELPIASPSLWKEYSLALHDAEATSKFLRSCGRFPLTARGDINTYSIFAEHFTNLVAPHGQVGMLVPTGIATDNTNQEFFRSLVETGRLASLYDFENREKLFLAVDSRYKFCLLTLRGAGDGSSQPARFAFFLTGTDHLRDPQRLFTLDSADFALLNPNTRTCPIFRTQVDAELTRKIYRRVPVLVNEETGENPWGIHFATMFHMSNDSSLFRTREQLEREGFHLLGNRFVKGAEVWLPLYEAKMIHHFDHRFGSFEGVANRSNTEIPTPTEAQYADPSRVIQPWYWVPQTEVAERLREWPHSWLLGFRDITNTTNERTAIFSLLPRAGVGNNLPLILSIQGAIPYSCFLANTCTSIFDWSVRQKIAGTHMNFFYVEQFPVFPPSAYRPEDLSFIVPRILELVYTAWDIKPFADDLWREADEPMRELLQSQWNANQATTGGHPWAPPEWAEIASDGIPLPPFRWNEERRALLRAELDAYSAKFYGLTEEELRYILDPQDVYGPDFPSETFRVLKEKETKRFGEYRTRRLILAAWSKLQ